MKLNPFCLEKISFWTRNYFYSIAHINELKAIDILKQSEVNKLKKSLNVLRTKYQNNSFKLTPDFEDSHSAIEYFLINELGDLGAKIHTVEVEMIKYWSH